MALRFVPMRSNRGDFHPLDALQAHTDPYSTRQPRSGGVAEWFKAAVLKTAERKFRGFESLLLLLLSPIDKRIVVNASGGSRVPAV
jgi:hypothetical protein